MLIRWEDLQPGDKLKLTEEMLDIVKNNNSWFNKEWLYYDFMTVEWIDIQGDNIWISFEESPSCWCISYDGKDSNKEFNDIVVFKVVELGE